MSKTKIKRVFMYKMYRENWFEVVYHSGKIVTYTQPNLPRTVEKFVSEATTRTEHFSKTFNRAEMVFAN